MEYTQRRAKDHKTRNKGKCERKCACLCVCVIPTHAQFLKKIKDKVNKGIDKTVDKAVGTDKPQTEIEKKEDAASSEYSDATENIEKPVWQWMDREKGE